jgi:hypothetical protein
MKDVTFRRSRKRRARGLIRSNCLQEVLDGLSDHSLNEWERTMAWDIRKAAIERGEFGCVEHHQRSSQPPVAVPEVVLGIERAHSSPRAEGA